MRSVAKSPSRLVVLLPGKDRVGQLGRRESHLAVRRTRPAFGDERGTIEAFAAQAWKKLA
jgi:hypothetical protein